MKSNFFILAALLFTQVSGQISGQESVAKDPKSRAIHLEKNISIQFSNKDSLKIFKNSKVVQEIDLNKKVIKKNAAEVLEHDLEEEDLGGSAGGKKKYLHEKRKVHGKKISQKIANQDSAKINKDIISTEKYANGKLEKRSYANSAYSYFIRHDENGAKYEEELYYDAKGNLRSTQSKGKDKNIAWEFVEWADGTLVRKYKHPKATVTFRYNYPENSYQMSVLNAEQDLLFESQ